MWMRTKLALTTLAIGATLACGVAESPVGARFAGTAYAQQKPEVDLAGEWDKAHETALRESAKAYETLYKWCKDKKLDFTAISARRLILRYDPENEEVRKFVGYMKTPDGKWERNEARRDSIREEADIEDPKAQKYPEKQLSTNKSVLGKWKALAQKAKKNGEDAAKADPTAAEPWAKKAALAWERVLQVDSSNEEAHKSLQHPKFGGKYVRPEAVPFLKMRDERKQGGLKRAAMPFKTENIDMDGLLKAAGLTGGAAKSEHVEINTVHGKEVAARLCVWAERALTDFVEIYGVDADVKNRLGMNKFDVVKDKTELEKISHAGGWPAAKVAEYTKYFGGYQIVPGQYASTNSAGADADDSVMHRIGHIVGEAARNMAIQDVGSPNGGIEDYLQETIAYDLTRRLTGTTLTTCGTFGKYGMDIEPNPNRDIWIELAKRQVEYDDDVPLATRLWKVSLQNQDLKGPETVKGYALIQFLFESDVEKGRKFVWTALAQGTPKAVESVYGITMEELDAQYRDWILKSW